MKRLLWVLALIGLPAIRAGAGDTAIDPRYPFHTDFANANLPWYEPRPGEFPPHHSDRRISGELVAADFIHRTGQFRVSKTGDRADFTMPPYGAVNYLNAEANLRDVPLGTFFLFFLNQDSQGNFTRLAAMQDQYTMDAGHRFSYRLDALLITEGKLLTTKQSIAKKQPDLGKRELQVNDQTRVWKGTAPMKLADLVTGDELLFNLTGKSAGSAGYCTDIWVGAETHKQVSEQQRAKFAASVKLCGLPGWIDQIEGNKLTVTLFSGDPDTFKETWLSAFEIGKEMRVVVGNDELRTWNPPVDNEHSVLLEVQKGPVAAYGTSGVRLVFNVAHLLEGFRKGRVVRIFANGWVLKDQPYGQSLMGYGYGAPQDADLLENVAKEYPSQFPFRTDYGNDHLPWYQIKDAEAPPRFSEHVVLGELVKADAGGSGGQFRTDRTAEVVEFTRIPRGSVRYLNADAELPDIPIRTRCRFSLYQDEHGAFTRAARVTDEFSHFAANSVLGRIEALDAARSKLDIAWQIPKVKNYNGDLEQPQDIGHSRLSVTPETRIWKDSQQVKVDGLNIGDVILFNTTADEPGSPAHCTDVWAGAETQTHAIAEQERRHSTLRR